MLGITGEDHGPAVAETIAAVHGVSHVPVLVGGGGVPSAEAAKAFGADGWTGTNARSAVAAVETIVKR
jgi:methanogenic corrinoid protein MtbC1